MVSRARARKHRGQALVLGLMFLFASAGVLFYLYNNGQVVTEKIRLTNAADAAAFSAATLEARALNYDAYANRAMVANEIAIAQIVSFISWVHYLETLLDNSYALIGTIGAWLYPVTDPARSAQLVAVVGGTSYVNTLTGGWGMSALKNFADYAMPRWITAHDAAVTALSTSQSVLHASLLAGLAQGALANDVVKSIDPDMVAEVVLTSHGFDGFTKAYAKNGSSGDERGRFADVTLRSRDDFTRERSWTIKGPDIPFYQKNVALKRRGGTDLVGYDEWRAVDTLENHGQRFGCGKGGMSWCGDVQEPIAWGATEVNAGDGDQGPGYHGNSYGENPRTSKVADSNMLHLNDQGAIFSGLPTTRDLRDLEAADPRTGITIRVAKSRNHLRTSGSGVSIVQPSGRLAQFGANAPGGEMAALSRAEVFFERPVARDDGKEELPNLFNPYWQVRLVSPTTSDKLYAAARQGGLLLP